MLNHLPIKVGMFKKHITLTSFEASLCIFVVNTIGKHKAAPIHMYNVLVFEAFFTFILLQQKNHLLCVQVEDMFKWL
jgi:hypothetical protein